MMLRREIVQKIYMEKIAHKNVLLIFVWEEISLPESMLKQIRMEGWQHEFDLFIQLLEMIKTERLNIL